MTASRPLRAAPAPPATTPPPDHLARSVDLWSSTVEDFDLEPHQLELLRRACEASDTADAAGEVVRAEGVTVLDRFGAARAHPAVAVERDARTAVARLLRELRLDEEPAEARPPRRGGRR
jgi:phage terminase small subunit